MIKYQSKQFIGFYFGCILDIEIYILIEKFNKNNIKKN